MRKVLFIILAIALFGTTIFFILSEFDTLLKYNMTYRELVKERGVNSYISLYFRYFLAYPISGILILLHIPKLKQIEKGETE